MRSSSQTIYKRGRISFMKKLMNTRTFLFLIAIIGIAAIVGCSASGSGGAATTPPPVVALGPAPVLLGTAGDYAILAQSAVSISAHSSIIANGNVAISPGFAAALTGFTKHPVGAINLSSYLTADEVGGVLLSADMLPAVGTTLAAAAVDMGTAYTDASNRTQDVVLNAGAGGEIGALTLAPGLYKWDGAGSVTITGSDLTLSGGANDVWIFQIPGTLTTATNVVLNGAQAKNIFWQVAGNVALGAGSHFEGIILGGPISETTLASGVIMTGSLLSQTAVSMGTTASLTKNP